MLLVVIFSIFPTARHCHLKNVENEVDLGQNTPLQVLFILTLKTVILLFSSSQVLNRERRSQSV